MNYFGPHYPHYLPEPYHSMYESAAIPPWGNFQDRPQTPHYGYRWLRQRWCAPSDDWAHYARILAAYYGQITLLEHQIERVLQSLDRLGLTSSTLVIFTSDHGEMGGGHGLLQKGAVPYDELYRIPLIARWPGVIDAGRTCDARSAAPRLPRWMDAASCLGYMGSRRATGPTRCSASISQHRQVIRNSRWCARRPTNWR